MGNISTPISQLLTLENIPKELSFLETSLASFLDDIHYDLHEVSTSYDGTTTTHSVRIVTEQELGLTIPGIDFRIVLNSISGNTSGFWFNVTTFKGILAFLPFFKIQNFSESLADFQDLASNYITLDMPNMLLICSELFETANNKEETSFNRINNYCGLSNQYDSNLDFYENFAILSNDILDNTSFSAWEIILNEFIYSQTGLSETEIKNKIALIFGRFFNPLLELTYEEFISFLKEQLIPSLGISVELNLGLEIPRKYLIPIKQDGTIEVDETKKITLSIADSILSYSTKTGFNIDDNVSLSFPSEYPLAQIGNTGLTIGFTGAKLISSDSSTGNKSIYFDLIEVGLPSKWFNQSNGATLGIFGENLIIGGSGISGTIGIKALGGGTATGELSYKLGQNISIGFSKFDVVFDKGKVTHSDIVGSLTVPIKGNTTKIDITMSFDDNGDFKIIGAVKAGVPIPVGNEFLISLFSVEVGEKDDQFYLACAADLSFPNGSVVNTTLGITEPFHLQKLLIWENGRIELEGGTLPLPSSLTVPLGFGCLL